MAPGKEDKREEQMLMGLMPRKEAEGEERENIVCVIRDETTIDWKSNKIVINLDRKTTMMKLYKIVAEKANYIVDSFLLSLLKPSNDKKEEEEVVLTDSSETTLNEAVGDVKTKRSNFILKCKNGKNPIRRVQQASEDGDENDIPETGMSSLFEEETSFSSTTNNTLKGISFARAESGFVGLINQAMTCYLNSLLQTLFMTPEFRNALYRWKFTGNSEQASKSIPFQLQKLFLRLQTSKKKAVETTDLTRSFGWDSSEAWQQHDVQELCRVMFDALEETLKNTDQANLINQLYQGKMKDYVKCLKCSHESARNDTYLDIPLAIRPFGAKESFNSIEEAFTAFTTPEVLNGNNQYFCEKCNTKQDAHKGLKFLTFPNCITIQLKRFSYDYTTGQRIKLHDRVTFPEVIKMNEFLHNDEPKVSRTNSDISRVLETVVNGDAESSFYGGEEQKEIGNFNANNIEAPSEVYELFSIMIHSGNALGGHYYAYIKSFADGKWYCFNDQHVYEISRKDIEKSYGGLDTSSKGYYSATYSSSTNAYMLMYRKKNAADRMAFDDPSTWPNHLISLRKRLIGEENDEMERKTRDRDVCKIRLFCAHPKTGKWIETKLHVEQSKSLNEATKAAWQLLELENVVDLERCRLVKYDDNYGSYERSFDGEENVEIGVLLGGVKCSYAFDLLLETKDEHKQFPVYEIGGTTVRVYNVDLGQMKVEDPLVLHAKRDSTLLELKNLIEEKFNLPAQSMRMAVGKDNHDLRLLDDPNKTLNYEGFYKSAKVYIETSGGLDSEKIFEESSFAKILDAHANTIRLIIVLPFTDLDENSKEPKEIVLKVDKRKTLGDLKKQISERIGVPVDLFRVYRVYSNNQEYEVVRVNDQLLAYCDETKIIIRLGRALKFGETRIKIYFLQPNKDEHCKFLLESVVSDGLKVQDIKNEILTELKKSFDIQTTSERLRLRKKSWKNPSTVYLDENVFDVDIKLTTHTEFFVEVVKENLQKTNPEALIVYVKQWKPSEYTLGCFEEVLLENQTIECLKSKLSELSELPKDDIEFAKGKGYFPYDMSVLKIHKELEWNPDVTKVNEYPLTITDDGSVIFYRDRNEKLGELPEERKKEIIERERKRLQRNNVPSYSHKEKALKIYTNKSG